MTNVDRYDEKLRAVLGERIRQTDSREGEAPGEGEAPAEGEGEAPAEGEGEAPAEPQRAELSRWNLVRMLLTERGGAALNRISEHYKLRVYFLTGARPSRQREAPAEPVSVAELVGQIGNHKPAGESTRLGAGVRRVLDDLRGTAPAAIVLLSDGINTDGPPLSGAAELARRKGVPLFFIGIGDERPAHDLKLADLLVDEVVFAGDVVNFEFKLTGAGFAGRKVAVVLRERGKQHVLAKMDVTIAPDGQPQQERLPYKPAKVGKFDYVVEVEALDGELQTDNNRQRRTIRVSDKKVNVLLVQAYPSFEFRYLWNMLFLDNSITVHAVLQQADPEVVRQEAGPNEDKQALRAFPVRRDDLFKYDVVILGDVDPALLSASMMQNLADFVDQPGKGGALIFIAGERFMPSAYRDTPLARLMPIDPGSVRYPEPGRPITEGFVVRPTELGLASPQMQLGDTPAETRGIWKNLPPLYWMLEAPDLKPAVRVLAEHPRRRGHDGRPLPLVCMQYVGAGKVLFHCVDATWRWRYRVGDVFFARYWVQTIRFLSRSKLSRADRPAELKADRREYGQGEPVRLRVRFADERLAPADDDGVTVVLELAGHKTRRIKLHRAGTRRGTFEGLLTSPVKGKYHAWVAIPTLQGRAPAVDFIVKPPAGEFERIRMAAAEMQRAAERSKGRFYSFAVTEDPIGKLLDDLPPGRQVPIESLPPEPLWNKWPLLMLFLVLLVGEWILRKAKGMV